MGANDKQVAAWFVSQFKQKYLHLNDRFTDVKKWAAHVCIKNQTFF